MASPPILFSFFLLSLNGHTDDWASPARGSRKPETPNFWASMTSKSIYYDKKTALAKYPRVKKRGIYSHLWVRVCYQLYRNFRPESCACLHGCTLRHAERLCELRLWYGYGCSLRTKWRRFWDCTREVLRLAREEPFYVVSPLLQSLGSGR